MQNILTEEHGGIVANNKNYIVAFMSRVKPDTIMVKESAPCEWICSGGEDQVRPYRILVKKMTIKVLQL